MKRKSKKKERLWSYRIKLLGDTFYLCLTAALLRFQGVQLKPLANLQVKTSPVCGNYLFNNCAISIPVFLQDLVYEFNLVKNSDLSTGDYCLTIELHDLHSSDLTTTVKSFPIWMFWYKPSDEVVKQAEQYINQESNSYSVGIIVYLQLSPNLNKFSDDNILEIEKETNLVFSDIDNYYVSECFFTQEKEKIWLCKLSNPLISESFNSVVDFLSQEVIKFLINKYLNKEII